MRLGQRKLAEKQRRNDWIWKVRDRLTIYEIAEHLERSGAKLSPSRVANIIRQRRSQEQEIPHHDEVEKV